MGRRLPAASAVLQSCLGSLRALCVPCPGRGEDEAPLDPSPSQPQDGELGFIGMFSFLEKGTNCAVI